MRKVSILLTAFLLFGLCSAVLAQEDDEASDVLELCLTGGLAIPSGGISDFGDSLGAKSGWKIGLDFGYFLKPNVIIGFNFGYSRLGVDATDEASTMHHHLYNPNIYAKYYFEGESNLVPYLRAHVGLENPKFATFVVSDAGNRYREKSYNPSLAYGLGVGIFYYTADYSGLFIEAVYHAASTKNSTTSYSGVDYEFGESLGTIGLQAGIRILVGADE